jgi:hypothetical protein
MSFDDALQTNAADEEQLARARAVEKERLRRRAALWRQLLSTRDGREFVWDVLLPELGLFEAGLHLEAHQLFALEGRRNVARKFWALITRDHARLFLEMQGEAIERAERQRQENQAARVKRTTE